VERRGGQAAQPIAFVGKGVTFDTGGISIKPADGMEDMKWDMGGAAAVTGVMHALAGRKAKVNAIGILGLVENMPDGNAQRPGDVVTSMSGQTIEVINTDAEGRLVLADALWYCQDRFKPQFMIDLATLTGAIIISLGHDYAGLFSNNDGLSEKLLAAGKAEREPLWRLPLPAAYEKQIESPIADMKNIGGRPAGSITAACSCRSSSTACRGRTWTSPPWPGEAVDRSDRAGRRGRLRRPPAQPPRRRRLRRLIMSAALRGLVLPSGAEQRRTGAARTAGKDPGARLEGAGAGRRSWPHGRSRRPPVDLSRRDLPAARPGQRADGRAPAGAVDRPDRQPGRPRCVVPHRRGRAGRSGRHVPLHPLFDGRDESALAQARGRWAGFKKAGHPVSYWRQGAERGWEKQA
jgi:hypothetical protein